jgi:beta-lactamase regulating signal transducer with metallopeptidase domain
LRVIGVVYLLALIYMLVTHIKKHLQLKWILGFTSQPPGEIAAAFHPLAENLGVGRSRLLVLSGVTSPATFGWIRPTILLPDVCLEQDRSDLEDILRHELHHVRRWDFVWNGFAVACRALLFFHPAAWYAVKRIQFDRELACDLAAVSDSPKGRAKYAESLIHFARLSSSQDSRNWGIDFAASSEHLKARVHSILAGTKKSSAWAVWSRIACGLALLACFVDIEPSLGVLLSYAQQQIAQPLAAEIRAVPAKTETRVRATRRGRSSRELTPTSADSAVANVSETPQPTDLSAERKSDGSAAVQSAGPQLLHRGSAASRNGAKQQTVVLIDDASGQVSKAGDHDHKQILQQTATAAALLKRLAEFDHH